MYIYILYVYIYWSTLADQYRGEGSQPAIHAPYTPTPYTPTPYTPTPYTPTPYTLHPTPYNHISGTKHMRTPPRRTLP